MYIISQITNVDPFRYYTKWLLFGYTRIKLYNGQYDFNKPFKTVVKLNKDGNVISKCYRYNSTNIGEVDIHSNGVAYYCGRYEWKKI